MSEIRLCQKKECKYRRNSTVMIEKKKTKTIVSIVRIIARIILSNSDIFLRCTNRTDKCKSPKD